MNVLAVGAHPDDVEMSCAGTLAKMVQRGDRVTAAHVALGDAGSFQLDADSTARIRAREAQDAAAILGVEYQRISIDISDCRINSANESHREALVDLVRVAKPDLVITHSPDDYMSDHNEVSKLVFGATFAASLPNYATHYSYHSKVPALYYMDTEGGIGFQPSEFVDISETIELKVTALAAHQSQLTWLKEHDSVDMVEQMKSIARFRGLQCQVEYAEGFTPCQTWLRTFSYRLLP
jgi:LmbE family N-acetylglucosaminyl deacetylase